MARVFIGVGSNEGDRLALISQAIRHLGDTQNLRVLQMATIAETEPMGGPPQGPYLNTVIAIDTTLAPRVLLSVLQGVERQLGRAPSSPRWGPRPIDLDILLYENQIINEPTLQIPHPRMHERRFVLEPLAQLASNVIHPVLHHSIATLLEQLTSHETASTDA